MRKIKLSTIDLQVFNHLQKIFIRRITVNQISRNELQSIDIKYGLVKFINSNASISFRYETQSGFKDFEFPNVENFLEMSSLCGANSKIFIDDHKSLKIKSKKGECNFNEGNSLNLRNPNTHHKNNDRLFSKEDDDICFKISSLDFEDFRQRYRNINKISKIRYIHLFTNIASEIVIAFEVNKYRHTSLHNTFIKSNKDFYLILDRKEHPFKFLLRDNYEVRIKKHGENLDACITFHNLSIPLITSFFCKQKEKNYCPLGDFNEVVTAFEPIQEEPKIEKTKKPVSNKFEGLERFTK